MAMKLETRVFELSNGKYVSLTKLAKAMGISLSQVYRVLHGERSISQKFIIGAIKAFPEHNLDDLFYVAQGEGRVTSRRAEVIKLSKAGVSNAEIGRRLGMSRKRARQIVKGIPTPQQSAAMLTTSDVAQFLGLHPNTVRRWSKKGILKSYRISSRGDRRFQREDVNGFLEEKEGEIE
jgi:excisionase family DNA binding protein